MSSMHSSLSLGLHTGIIPIPHRSMSSPPNQQPPKSTEKASKTRQAEYTVERVAELVVHRDIANEQIEQISGKG
ncbi:hypothetical protein CVT26_009425 [Gymnopilus dilepis]|uniref:Uncharacterized protein n=1 Tax=Gymnopilus dilepis TaxID=231916 RepID=A0A409VK73_9AGAR|nr:hypothetical protein CVT26_009425 [Gymnopilus dilepis]